MRVIFADAAERDLTDIALTIAQHDARVAVAFVGGIRRHCDKLALMPFLGRPRADVGRDIRSFAHRPYVVYYRIKEDLDRVEILRIWHGRRRLPRKRDLG